MSKPFVCWDPAKVGDYFNIEASSTIAKLGWEVFRRLHVPIRRIEVLGGRLSLRTFTDTVRSGEERTFIDEEELLRAVLEAQEGENFLIGVRGGPGSGKSHLIRWLEMRLQEHANFLPIPVPRELDSVGAVLNRIACAAGVEKSYQEKPDVDIEDLTDYLVANIKILARWSREAEKNAVRSPEFRRLVRKSVDRYLAHRIERRTGRRGMAAPDLHQTELRDLFADHVGDDQAAAAAFCDQIGELYTRAWVLYAVGKPVNVIDFLREVQESARSRDQRPVLLMEDVTSFEVLHRELFNFLTALSAGSFVAVLGWTTAYEKDNLPTNILDRLALRVSLTDESVARTGEESYALRDSDDVVRFAQTYMHAVRQAHCGRGCVNGACLAGAGDELYPFTKEAIDSFYRSLVDRDSRAERRTPRLLLSTVMHPLLQAAATFDRFPKMEDVLSVDPRPVPASYRALGAEFADWVQLKLWFTTKDTPLTYFDDLGIRRPDPEPEVGSVPEPPDGVRTRREKMERDYRNQVRKLENWLKGETLESVDTWLNWLEARIPTPMAAPLEPGQGRRVKIEGSGAARAAPFAVAFQRTQQTRDLLQSIARREVYGMYELNWEAIYVHGRLALAQRQAERQWIDHLKGTAPILGLFLEVVALATAFRGQLEHDDLPSVLTAVVSDPVNRGAPLLSRETQDIKSAIEPLATRIAAGFRTAYPEKQDTFDVALFSSSLAAYRNLVRQGRRLTDAMSTRLGKETFTADELSAADEKIRTFYLARLQQEIELVGLAVTKFRQARPLGREFAESLQQLRDVYANWKSPALAATVWREYQDAWQQWHPLIPNSVEERHHLAEGIEQGWNEVEREESLLVKLSRMSAWRANVLRAAAAIAGPAQKALNKINHEVQEAERGNTTARVARAEIDRALEELEAAIDEVSPS